MKKFWYINCPTCQQGRLFIEKDITENKLVLHCEECETVWRDPQKMTSDDPKASFLALTSGHIFEAPTEGEVDISGWKQYALHYTPID